MGPTAIAILLILLPFCADFKQYMSSPTVSSCFDEFETQKDQILSRSVQSDKAALCNVADEKHQQLDFLTDLVEEKDNVGNVSCYENNK